MSHVARRRLVANMSVRATRVAGVIAVAAAVLLPLGPPQAFAQTRAAAKPSAPAEAGAKVTKPGRPGRKTPRAAPKGPVASKNVAVGDNAVLARPKVLLSAGCLDARHGDWLVGELGDAAPQWQTQVQLDGSKFPGSSEGASEGPFEPDATAIRCVPFAAVRTPADRIESLAFLPSAVPTAAARVRRVMVVSRVDLSSAPATSWHDLSELADPSDLPAGYRELWLPAAGVLAGEAADHVPALWQRDVGLLVRQMKKQAQAAETALVRLVLHGEGEAARLVAVELVDDGTGLVIDSAIWLERTDAPSGFVSARGGDHERLLWQAPVDYRRISRGVGAATVIVRKRVFAQPKTPGGKPRMVIRSFRTRGQHQGIDFVAPTGTPVVTVAEGTVAHAGPSGGYGNLVVVDHGGGITTYYAHLSAFGAGIQEGAKVERGQEIGLVGSTGRSTGPHLHYEIRRDGRYLDPADPAQSLPSWGLAADEHRAVLTRLLALSLSRESAFARAMRQPSLAAAPQTAAAE